MTNEQTEINEPVPDMMDGFTPQYDEGDVDDHVDAPEAEEEATEPDTEAESETEEESNDAAAKIRVGEEEFEPEALKAIIRRGKEAESLEVNATHWQNLEANLLGDSKEAAVETLSRLTELVNEHFGISTEMGDPDSFTDTEKALSTENKRLNRELASVRSEIENLSKIVKDLEPVHKEVLSKQKEAADVARVKAVLKIDASPADISKARKATGIEDAAGAYAAWQASQPAKNERPKTPKSDERSSQPDMSDPDAIFRARMSKEVAVN